MPLIEKNDNKINLSFTSAELISMLLGGESHLSFKTTQHLSFFSFGCSHPGTTEEVVNQIYLMSEDDDKKDN